jgi:hypothetical protein
VSPEPKIFAVAKDEPAVASESFVDEIPAKAEALKIESAGKPLAFGSLLETPAAGTEDDATYVAPSSPELADRDWNGAEEEEGEEEEEDSASSTWRRDGGSDDFAPEPVEEKAADKATSRKRRESWTPTREKTQDLLEEAAALEIMPSAPIVITEAPVPQNAWGMPKPAEQTFAESKPIDVPVATEAEIETPVASAPEAAVHEPANTGGGNSWFSTSSSPWEAEAQKATQLASTWDTAAAPTASGASELVAEEPPVVEAPQPEEPVSYDFISEAPSEEPVHYVPDPGLVTNEVVEHNRLPGLISDGSISPETVETIRQDTIYALESVTENVPAKPAETAAKIAETPQQDMDTLVANVLAKMSPEMLQAVTREILKPVVAAMIRDEINGKKS